MNHIVILIHLNARLLTLDRVERQIHRARFVSMNQHFQLTLDRHLADVERTRMEIRQAMAEIRNSN